MQQPLWQKAASDFKCTVQMSISAKHWEGLLAILACSDAALRQVVQRWPGIADLAVADVMHRLLCLKVETTAACQTPAQHVERPINPQQESSK